MKRIISISICIILLAAIFAIPAAASDAVNTEVQLKYLQKAPQPDGRICIGEYSVIPIHSYPNDKSQFVDNEHNQYNESEWDIDFYATWDEDYLYMAWNVTSATFVAMPEADYNGDGIWDTSDYGYMWMYSCLQFIITPGAPKSGYTLYQETPYSGNYFEAGVALTQSGNIIRTQRSTPANASKISIFEWDAAVCVDENASLTTYEAKISWKALGLSNVGNGTQIGLSYAISAQDYNEKRGMIEWQNGILSNRDADSAAVITLAGKPEDRPIGPSQGDQDQLQNGLVPSEAKNNPQILIDDINTPIRGEKAHLITDPSVIKDNNNQWATSVLFKPVEGQKGYYEMVEIKTGCGESYSFDSYIEKGMIALIAHTDGMGIGADRVDTVRRLQKGDKVGLFGVDLKEGKLIYANAMLYVVEGASFDSDTSKDESQNNSNNPNDSSEDNSEDNSNDSSKDTPPETSNESSSSMSTDSSYDYSFDYSIDSSLDTSFDFNYSVPNVSFDNDFSFDYSFDEDIDASNNILGFLNGFGSNHWIIIGIVAACIIIALIIVVVVLVVSKNKPKNDMR